MPDVPLPDDERTLADEPRPGPPPPPLISDERTVFDDPAPSEEFDPYYRWLAIPKSEQPPNHYRLLGLPAFETDGDVILNSSERQMAHVKAQAGGKNLAVCQRLLSELSLARICLLDAKKKAEYDIRLRKELAARQRSAADLKSSSTKKSPTSRGTEKPAKPQGVPNSQKLASIPAPPMAARPIPKEPPPEPLAPPVQSTPERWKGAPEAPPTPTPPPSEPDAAQEVVFQRRPVEGEMDMTPMIDVTFLLLIFFICTASFALTLTKPIPAPKEDEPSTNAVTIEEFEDNPDYITVRIDAYNTFRVISLDNDEEAPSYQELIVKLRAVRQAGQDGRTPTTLMVIANGMALHEKVVQALDAGTEVGMEKLQLMTVENDDE